MLGALTVTALTDGYSAAFIEAAAIAVAGALVASVTLRRPPAPEATAEPESGGAAEAEPRVAQAA